jgi:SAM-dependent methyltransferase
MTSSDLQQAITLTRERLYPSVKNPNWLVLRKRREIFRRWLNRLPAKKLIVLDVGGRLQPYRELLGDRILRYTSVDLRWTPLVDVIATGAQLPFAAECFDLVICTQVLEYIPEPETMLSEIHRVLRPGGTLMLSAPTAQPRDADHECWGFHPAGIRKLLARYSDVEVIPEGGSITGFFRTVNACLNIFAKYAPIRFLFTITLFPFFNLVGLCLENLAGSSNDQFSVNHSALARKAD